MGRKEEKTGVGGYTISVTRASSVRFFLHFYPSLVLADTLSTGFIRVTLRVSSTFFFFFQRIPWHLGISMGR